MFCITSLNTILFGNMKYFTLLYFTGTLYYAVCLMKTISMITITVYFEETHIELLIKYNVIKLKIMKIKDIIHCSISMVMIL